MTYWLRHQPKARSVHNRHCIARGLNTSQDGTRDQLVQPGLSLRKDYPTPLNYSGARGRSLVRFPCAYADLAYTWPRGPSSVLASVTTLLPRRLRNDGFGAHTQPLSRRMLKPQPRHPADFTACRHKQSLLSLAMSTTYPLGLIGFFCYDSMEPAAHVAPPHKTTPCPAQRASNRMFCRAKRNEQPAHKSTHLLCPPKQHKDD